MAMKIHYDENGPFLSLWASGNNLETCEKLGIEASGPLKLPFKPLAGDATLRLSPLGLVMLRFLAADWDNRAYDPMASLARFLLRRQSWRYVSSWDSPLASPERAIRGRRTGISSFAEAKVVMLEKALLGASKCVIGPLSPEGRLWWGAVTALAAWQDARGMELRGKGMHGARELEWAVRMTYRRLQDKAGLPSLGWLAERAKAGVTWEAAGRLVGLYYEEAQGTRRDWASEDAMAQVAEETRRRRNRERQAEKKYHAERFLSRRDTYKDFAMAAKGDTRQGGLNPYGF